MQTVVFHVGCAKAASTSIQASLTKYRSLLFDEGYFYPLSPYQKQPEFALLASFNIFTSFCTYLNFIPRSFDQNANIRDFFKLRVSAYFSDFKNSHCHTLVLSDEILPYYCSTVEQLKRLRSLFPDDLDIRFIYYMRPPADMYTSLYSTLVKVDQTNLWPHQFYLPSTLDQSHQWICSPAMFDHSNFISNIQSVFGCDCVSSYHYCDILQSSDFASPVDHFFGLLGFKASCPLDCKSNPRLDYFSLYVLCIYNRAIRIFSSRRLLHLFLLDFRSKLLIPLLESFASFGFFRFPSRRILLRRRSFDKLFSF